MACTMDQTSWKQKRMFSERMAFARCAKFNRFNDDDDDTESAPERVDLNESSDLPRVEEPSDDELMNLIQKNFTKSG